MDNSREISPRETLISQLELQFKPIREKLVALQSENRGLLLELQKEATVGNDVRDQLGGSLGTASKFGQGRRFEDLLYNISQRKLVAVPSTETSEAISQGIARNIIPEDQSHIQMILEIPANLLAHYEQVLKEIMDFPDAEGLVEIFLKESETQLKRFEDYLKNQ